MPRFATRVALVCALAAFAFTQLAGRLAPVDHADGGPHHGLALLLEDREQSDAAPLFQGQDDAPDLARARALRLDDGKRRFRATWKGWLRIREAGPYAFATRSDDGSRLSVDGSAVVRNEGVHEPRSRTGGRYLQTGWHAIEVVYEQEGGGAELEVTWAPPGQPAQLLGPEVLWAKPPGSMDLWLIENVWEPLEEQRVAIGRAALASGVLAAIAGSVALATALARETLVRRAATALADTLRGSAARRTGTILALVFAACWVAWSQNEAARGGFRSSYRAAGDEAASASPGPWLDLAPDPNASHDARVDAAALGLPARLEQRWEGFVYAASAGSYWFEARGDAPSLVAIDQRLIVSHDGSAARGVASRARVLLERGVHPISLLAGLDSYQQDPVRFRWAPPDGPFRAFTASDVFTSAPTPAELESRLRSHAAQPAVRRVALALLAIVALALTVRPRTSAVLAEARR